MGWISHTWPRPSLWPTACDPLPPWDSLYLPNWLPSIQLSFIVHRASYSGNLFTGLQLLLTPRLVWLWSAQCRPEHISSRVCRIWIKLQQGQAERCLGPRAYCFCGSKWKRQGTFCAQTVILIGSLSLLCPGSPLSTLCSEETFRATFWVLALRWLPSSEIF